MSLSKASIVAAWPDDERASWLASLSPEIASALRWSWPFWGRPEQFAPGGRWRTWLLLAGRGFGKNRAGSEWVHEQAKDMPGSRGALVARTAADVRDVIVQGDSGLLNCGDPDFRPQYEPSKRRLTWPNGTTATCFSADEPDQLRGPQTHWGLCDEVASWSYPDAWDQFQLGLRLGDNPRAVVTTTPRPTKLLRELMASPDTVITRGTTFDNAENIDISAIVARFDGTTLGRQELYAEMLTDAPGAMWHRETVDAARLRESPELRRIVIGIDPAVTSGPDSDETGIIAAGLASAKVKVPGGRPQQHAYVLADRSGRFSPDTWARRAVQLYHDLKADMIVAEVNNGGDMVVHTIKTVDPSVPVRKIHSTRGKQTRAEPIAAQYEQGRVHHVGSFPELEDQMFTWQPGIDRKSPDRIDALVFALTDLTSATPTTGFKIPGGVIPNAVSGL